MPGGRPTDEPAAVWVPIGNVSVWKDNPRKNAAAIGEVAESIKRFGFASPIIARKADGQVIAGHTRLAAAQKLGLDVVPVRYLDLDPTDARLLALADNKLGEIAEWDTEALARVMAELEAEGALLDGLGWGSAELSALLDAPSSGETSGDDDVPETLPDAESRPGEVYQLGPHRLLCGDSTDVASWALDGPLLLGVSCDAVWTDPPYGVSYVGKTADALTIENDSLDNDQLAAFIRKMIAAVLPSCRPRAPWYVSAPAGPKGVPFAVELLAAGLFRQRLVWVKDRFVLGHSDYHYRHEDVYFGYAPGPGRAGRGGDAWHGGDARDTVLEVPRPSVNGDHPTMKPPELIAQCLEPHLRPGAVVADPFGGSGSTLIAAAKCGYQARLVELSPHYCDVIRRRWAKWATENGHDPGEGALNAATV